VPAICDNSVVSAPSLNPGASIENFSVTNQIPGFGACEGHVLWYDSPQV